MKAERRIAIESWAKSNFSFSHIKNYSPDADEFRRTRVAGDRKASPNEAIGERLKRLQRLIH